MHLMEDHKNVQAIFEGQFSMKTNICFKKPGAKSVETLKGRWASENLNNPHSEDISMTADKIC